MTQAARAAAFHALHKKGAPIILYNVWDAGSAGVVAAEGARAIATGSASVAAAQGYDDGEAIPLDHALAIYARITAVTDLPLTVDAEGGYADEPEPLAQNMRKILRCGAVGVNFEDQKVGEGTLYTTEAQSARIAAVRAAATGEGIDLFINARTDLFLKEPDPARHRDLVAPALARAAAYQAAGASGFFVPGLTEPELIQQIVEGTELPVNVMKLNQPISLSGLADLGVARISFGPVPYRAAMAAFAAQFNADCPAG